MTPEQIRDALGQQLELAALPFGVTIVWPGIDADPARPFVMFENVPVTVRDNTLTGADEVWIGFLSITVVTMMGRFDTEALQIAQSIREQFRYGKRIPAGGGAILINEPPKLHPATKDGPDWRQVVRVDYRTE